jgi:hypothetical protein
MLEKENQQMPEEFDVNALDELLSGNTTNNEPETTPEETDDVEPTEDTTVETTDGGGQDNLESSEEPAQETDKKPESDEGVDKQQAQASHNAAFAKMRKENTRLSRTVQQMAQALGIQEDDPAKVSEVLVEMAQNKLAKEANLPVEVYKELNQTKEQLHMLQLQQNQVTAREKFAGLKAEFDLDDKELIKFATQLDDDGINVVQNPNVDLTYEYYKRNRQALEEKRIAKAVEEALRKSNTADSKSSTPGNQQGKKADAEGKVNNVSALNDLLNSK